MNRADSARRRVAGWERTAKSVVAAAFSTGPFCPAPLVAALALSVVLAASACGGGAGTSPGHAPEGGTHGEASDSGADGEASAATAPSFSGAIGATGGTVGAITDGRGMVLTIPAGALTQMVSFTITPIASPVKGAFGQVYDIEPSGTQFAVPVTLKFPYTTAELGSTPPTKVAVNTVVSSAWQPISAPAVDTAAQTIAGTTTHLCDFGLAGYDGIWDFYSYHFVADASSAQYAFYGEIILYGIPSNDDSTCSSAAAGIAGISVGADPATGLKFNVTAAALTGTPSVHWDGCNITAMSLQFVGKTNGNTLNVVQATNEFVFTGNLAPSRPTGTWQFKKHWEGTWPAPTTDSNPPIPAPTLGEFSDPAASLPTTCCATAGQTLCDSRCTDLETDPGNCGACGTICAGLATCISGTCCPQGQTVCSGTCTDLSSDLANCGACGTACSGGTGCNAGACTCPSGDTTCGGACVNLQTDTSNCGACSVACAGPGPCSAGQCCPLLGQTACNGACTDMMTDTSNCGACGAVCPIGTSCNAGSCCATGSCCTGCPDSCYVTDVPSTVQGSPDTVTMACTATSASSVLVCPQSGSCPGNESCVLAVNSNTGVRYAYNGSVCDPTTAHDAGACAPAGSACHAGYQGCCTGAECNINAGPPGGNGVCVSSTTCLPHWTASQPGSACATTADCCPTSGECPATGGYCGGPMTSCLAASAACTQGSDCCTNQCNSGAIHPVCPTSTCGAAGATCTTDADCCGTPCNTTCGGACNTLANAAPAVTWTQTDLYIPPPTGTGGTLTAGTYYLESVTLYYTTAYSVYAQPQDQITLSVAGNTMNIVQNEPGEGGGYSTNSTGTATFTTSGVNIALTYTCHSIGGFAAYFAIGGGAPYTATSNTITFFATLDQTTQGWQFVLQQ